MVSAILSRLGVDGGELTLHVDEAPAVLVERALANGEGRLTSTGSLAVETGSFTGRAPKDRYIVDSPSVHDRVAWGAVNAPLPAQGFERLMDGVREYLAGRELYVTRGLAGADRSHARKFAVVCERASQALFAQQMLVRPAADEREAYGEPDFVVVAVPGFTCDPELCGTRTGTAVVINFEERVIVVAGTGYSGEIKKSIFSTMNYLLAVEDGVLPMHCSANMDPATGQTAVFFGLSGTGKTTLSADPARLLIGDDEHGWSDQSVFNIEGGCYAKCIDLDPAREPDIFGAIRFGSVSENVVMDPATRVVDYSDSSITENTRAAYPVEHIGNSLSSGVGGVPSVVVFLTADAFGVLPPISRLDEFGAMYHFMTGFTSKVAGTEVGVVEPQPTFSALFGEPFMPLNPLVYAAMLNDRIKQHDTRVYLVNTGWTAGGYGVGHRMSLRDTRAMVHAALDGTIEQAEFWHDDLLNLDVPLTCGDVDPALLRPRDSWADPQAYDEAARSLAALFAQNFEKRYPDAPDYVRNAGPRAE